MSIDPAIRANHSEFVEDRMNKPQLHPMAGGRLVTTHGPEMETSSSSWWGLRRAQRTPVSASPGLIPQVSDRNPDELSDKPSVSWASSG
jgi:hypothetical protein